MSYQESLREAFHVHKIRRVAIVDDGYDAPSAERLSAADVKNFEVNLKDAIVDDDPDGISREAAATGLGSLQEISSGWRNDDRLRSMWRTYVVDGRSRALGRLLHRLFQSYAVSRADKLEALSSLESLVKDAGGGVEPVAFDSQAKPTDLVEYDLVFLDYYLEEPQAADPTSIPASGRERSLAFLKELIEASPKGIPLVMLISSEATADDIPEFRRHAHMLASAVQFLPKREILGDLRRAEAILLGLIARRKEVDALWELLDLWQNAVSSASSDMMAVVRELDLPDYSYMQDYRLTNERMPLAHYLVWLFNGYLANLVEGRLNDVTAAKLINSLASAPTFPGRVAPTEAISTLYGSITASKVPMHIEGFEPKAWAGDVFVRTDFWHAIAGEDKTLDPPFDLPMPEVLAVVTPACDLVPDRSDKLRSVTTVGGSLHTLETAVQPSTHFLTIRERQFHVVWDPKWPVTIPIQSFGPSGPFEGRYRWVARLRELYHADLQQTLVRDVGRVGLPVAPPLPHWSALRVLLKVDGQFTEILAFGSKQRRVWTVFSTSKGERTLHIREDVAWEIRSRAMSLLRGKVGKASARMMANLDDAAFIERLHKSLPLKKDSHDVQALDFSVRKGLPHVGSDDGRGCDRSLLIVFGSDDEKPSSTIVVATDLPPATGAAITTDRGEAP